MQNAMGNVQGKCNGEYALNTLVVNTEYLCTMKEDEVDLGVYGRDLCAGERVAVMIELLEEEVRWVLLGVDGEMVLPFLRLDVEDGGTFCSSSSSSCGS